MNTLNRAKILIGIDPSYDIDSPSLGELDAAKTIFVGAYTHYSQWWDDEPEDRIIAGSLAAVWHAAKQYYAQHPAKLYKTVQL